MGKDNTFSGLEYSNNKCPKCKKYSLEQMDNFTGEFSATRYKCYYCQKNFAIWIKDDLDAQKLIEYYPPQDSRKFNIN